MKQAIVYIILFVGQLLFAGEKPLQCYKEKDLTGLISTTITISSFDGQVHRSEAHYRHLLAIFEQELHPDGALKEIRVVFVPRAVWEALPLYNPDRFHSGTVAVALFPKSIMMPGDLESDGSFFHELVHLFRAKEFLFKDIPEASVEAVTIEVEADLLTSRRYIDYLKSLTESKQ